MLCSYGILIWIGFFAQIKDLITKTPVLAYYDVEKDVQLQVDASSKGLGTVLLQDDQPIAFSSKTLTSSEQHYAQIEKELYAILFGCEKFHQYIYMEKLFMCNQIINLLNQL